MAESLRVAALQMVSSDEIDANLDRARQLLQRAADRGARLAVLPECFSLMGSGQQLRAAARDEAATGRVEATLAATARELDIAIVGGTVGIDDDNGKSRAAVLFYGASGDCLGRYDKMHLFDADVGDERGSYRESDSYSAGDRIVVVAWAGLRVGLAVCYDLRFPEMFRVMQSRGVDVIAVPAAFTRRTGLAHWLPLVRARAIENQCAVVGANQGGAHSGRRQTSGGSVIVDGWGRVCAEAGFGECCLVADIDLVAQAQWRAAMPVVNHRRIDVIE